MVYSALCTAQGEFHTHLLTSISKCAQFHALHTFYGLAVMRFTNALLETHARAFWYSVSQLNFDEINIIYNKHIHFIHIYL